MPIVGLFRFVPLPMGTSETTVIIKVSAHTHAPNEVTHLHWQRRNAWRRSDTVFAANVARMKLWLFSEVIVQSGKLYIDYNLWLLFCAIEEWGRWPRKCATVKINTNSSMIRIRTPRSTQRLLEGFATVNRWFSIHSFIFSLIWRFSCGIHSIYK